MGSVLVAVVLALWLLLTVVGALPRTGGALRKRIPAWFAPLLPSWTFFAPNPATKDKVQMYRDILANGSVSPLRLVLPEGGARGRAGKALFDAASHLTQGAARGREEEPDTRVRDARLMIGTPYLLLLNRAAAAPHDAAAVAFEFVIVHASLREEDPQVVFVSAVHRLETAVGRAQPGMWEPGAPEPSARKPSAREPGEQPTATGEAGPRRVGARKGTRC
ncbi:hypothetical protein ACFOSC_08730 [Streptantibioticus rubrisoli]|uniref:Uncharacterized protein n=1 Tax=Streptantibioticus rubrisoli TaxID=1387313 RepID=A0ABT1P606_9ACTN|nr:hypothetical protein [Streptantibioticus rubrisoli]MCQ4040794.1 hypothetical protein [Streptantibioticus rubrisoli]